MVYPVFLDQVTSASVYISVKNIYFDMDGQISYNANLTSVSITKFDFVFYSSMNNKIKVMDYYFLILTNDLTNPYQFHNHYRFYQLNNCINSYSYSFVESLSYSLNMAGGITSMVSINGFSASLLKTLSISISY